MASTYDRYINRKFKSPKEAIELLEKYFVEIEQTKKMSHQVIVRLHGIWEQCQAWEPKWVWEPTGELAEDEDGEDHALFTTLAAIRKSPDGKYSL